LFFPFIILGIIIVEKRHCFLFRSILSILAGVTLMLLRRDRGMGRWCLRIFLRIRSSGAMGGRDSLLNRKGDRLTGAFSLDILLDSRRFAGLQVNKFFGLLVFFAEVVLLLLRQGICFKTRSNYGYANALLK